MRIAEYKDSGQSVRAWCADRDVKPNQLWYWLRKEKESAEPKLSWLPLNLSDASFQNALVIRVGWVAIDVKPGFDPKLLLDVVKTLATITSYRDTFKLLIRYCQEQKRLSAEKLELTMLTPQLISDFLDWLERERKCSISTRN